MKSVWYILSICVVFLGIACSGGGDVAGNSSETGNCRVVGIVTADPGISVDSVPVVLAPDSFTAGSDTVELLTAYTDSAGEYRFDSVPPGTWTLSARDEIQQVALIHQDISLDPGDSATVDEELTESGAITVTRSGVGGEVSLAVRGTPWGGEMVQGEVVHILTNIATTEPIVVEMVTPEGEVIMSDSVEAVAGDTVQVKQSRNALVITGNGENVLANYYETQIRTATLFPVHISSDTLTVAHLDDAALYMLVGTAAPSQEVMNSLKTTSRPVVNGVPLLFPLLGMTDSVAETDFGSDSTAGSFVWGDSTDHGSLSLMSTTPVTGDSVQVIDQNDLTWGKPGGEFIPVGVVAGSSDKYTVFLYDMGDTLTNQSVSSGRRAGIFTSSAQLSSSGELLLAGILSWMMGF